MSRHILARPEFSDGSKMFHPNERRNIKETGEISYFHPPPSTEPRIVRFLAKLAETIWPELPNEIRSQVNMQCTLDKLPKGYRYYLHFKSPKDGKESGKEWAGGMKHKLNLPFDTKGLRVDPYVFGHPSGRRFRSVNEMVPHMIWLYTDSSRKHSNCKCLYCPLVVKQQMALGNSLSAHIISVPFDRSGLVEHEEEQVVPIFRYREVVIAEVAVFDERRLEQAELKIQGLFGVPHFGGGQIEKREEAARKVIGWPCIIEKAFAVEARTVFVGGKQNGAWVQYSVRFLGLQEGVVKVNQSCLIPYLKWDESRNDCLRDHPSYQKASLELSTVSQRAIKFGKFKYTIQLREDMDRERYEWLQMRSESPHYRGVLLGCEKVVLHDVVRVKQPPGERLRCLLVRCIFQHEDTLCFGGDLFALDESDSQKQWLPLSTSSQEVSISVSDICGRYYHDILVEHSVNITQFLADDDSVDPPGITRYLNLSTKLTIAGSHNPTKPHKVLKPTKSKRAPVSSSSRTTPMPITVSDKKADDNIISIEVDLSNIPSGTLPSTPLFRFKEIVYARLHCDESVLTNTSNIKVYQRNGSLYLSHRNLDSLPTDINNGPPLHWPARILSATVVPNTKDQSEWLIYYKINLFGDNINILLIDERNLIPYLSYYPERNVWHDKLSSNILYASHFQEATDLSLAVIPFQKHVHYYSECSKLDKDRTAWLFRLNDYAHYKGIMLGCEKIVLGDTVRLKRSSWGDGNVPEYLVVYTIYIIPEDEDGIHLSGDLYTKGTEEWSRVNPGVKEYNVCWKEVAGRYYRSCDNLKECNASLLLAPDDNLDPPGVTRQVNDTPRQLKIQKLKTKRVLGGSCSELPEAYSVQHKSPTLRVISVPFDTTDCPNTRVVPVFRYYETVVVKLYVINTASLHQFSQLNVFEESGNLFLAKEKDPVAPNTSKCSVVHWPCRISSAKAVLQQKEKGKPRLNILYQVKLMGMDKPNVTVGQLSLIPVCKYNQERDPLKHFLSSNVCYQEAFAALNESKKQIIRFGEHSYTHPLCASLDKKDNHWLFKMNNYPHYEGLLYGCEKILLNDVVRLKRSLHQNNQDEYLFVRTIYQIPKDQHGLLYFSGDIYYLQQIREPDGSLNKNFVQVKPGVEEYNVTIKDIAGRYYNSYNVEGECSAVTMLDVDDSVTLPGITKYITPSKYNTSNAAVGSSTAIVTDYQSAASKRKQSTSPEEQSQETNPRAKKVKTALLSQLFPVPYVESTSPNVIPDTNVTLSLDSTDGSLEASNTNELPQSGSGLQHDSPEVICLVSDDEDQSQPPTSTSPPPNPEPKLESSTASTPSHGSPIGTSPVLTAGTSKTTCSSDVFYGSLKWSLFEGVYAGTWIAKQWRGPSHQNQAVIFEFSALPEKKMSSGCSLRNLSSTERL
jgi:hypothetical protein